jgi:hypothetical protein
MRRRNLAGALAMLTLLVGLRPARAEVSAAEREARRDFEEAEISYRGGRYAEAVVKYQSGYAAMPLPGFLVNIAQCQRRLGDLKTARATYREFVLVAPDSRLVPEVEKLIHQLDGLIADLAAGGDGAAAAQIGAGADVHASDPSAPPPLALAAPGPSTDNAALVASPAPVSEAATPRSHARWWLWGGLSAAAVAAGVIAGLALASSGTTTVHSGTLGTFSR